MCDLEPFSEIRSHIPIMLALCLLLFMLKNYAAWSYDKAGCISYGIYKNYRKILMVECPAERFDKLLKIFSTKLFSYYIKFSG